MEIINDYKMPATKRGTGATGSKFFTTEVKETAEKLEKGQAFIIPVMEGLTKGRQLTGTKWQFKQNFADGNKEFLIRMTDAGLAVQLINVKATIPAQPEAPKTKSSAKKAEDLVEA